VFVHAFVAAVGAAPEPAVLAVFDGVDEEFTDFIGRGFGVAVFAEDDLAEFFWKVEYNVSMCVGWKQSSSEGCGQTHPRPNPPCRPFSSHPLPLLSCPDRDSSSRLFAQPLDHD